ncbi:hypothetical protein [Poseidonocella sp. HB161398]|uniref:hypothetical protein n=1 Tax=Poseidonocella sp. HB161398 TaxID=2320855 RepID=UPI001107B762|nr:hypothetical protein [Poseidonocella sp. HB161398]
MTSTSTSTTETAAKAALVAFWVADFQARRAELCDMIAPKGCTTIASHSWVVVMPGDMVLSFTFESAGQGRRRATGSAVCPIEKAPRFTRADAEALAADCRNGKGELGTAMHWRDVVKAEVASLDDTIARLTA